MCSGRAEWGQLRIFGGWSPLVFVRRDEGPDRVLEAAAPEGPPQSERERSRPRPRFPIGIPRPGPGVRQVRKPWDQAREPDCRLQDFRGPRSPERTEWFDVDPGRRERGEHGDEAEGHA